MPKFDLNYLTQELRKHLGEPCSTEKIIKTLDVAYRLHSGQFRETRNSLSRPPYILHPVGVAILAHKHLDLVTLPDSHEDIIMAALTHDILEDTDLTASELGRICSARVAEIVQSLTKPGVRQNETHVERNQRFLDQIIRGGVSPMYLKICDSMHNLGRPGQSPPKLIKKAIRKARNDYMTFFDKGLNSTKFKRLYESRIHETSKQVQKIEVEESGKPPLTLEEAINRAVLYSGQKVIELHDIRDIFEELTSAAFSLELPSNEILDYILGEHPSIHQKIRVALNKKIESGMIARKDMPKTLRNGLWEGVDRLFILDTGFKGIGDAARVYLFGYSNKLCPAWVNQNTLKLIFNFLTERLRSTERTKYVALSSDAGTLGIDLLPGDIEQAAFTYEGLIELRDLLKNADYIRNLLKTELLKIFEEKEINLVTAIESRIKEPRSIVNKLKRRKYSSIKEVEDIVGFRFVCLDTSDQKKIYTVISEVCKSSILVASTPKSEQTFHFGLVHSKEGYKACHFLASFHTGKKHYLPVTCEFQIRTVFQDAWARVSNTVMYKKSRKTNHVVECLNNLAELRDKSDAIIDQLFMTEQK